VPTHTEEQRQLLEETRAAFHTAVDDDDDGLLIPREKTKDEIELEEEEYRDYLKREVGEDLEGLIVVGNSGGNEKSEDDTVKEKESKKKKKKSTKATEAKGKDTDQEFLMKSVVFRITRAIAQFAQLYSQPGMDRQIGKTSTHVQGDRQTQVEQC